MKINDATDSAAVGEKAAAANGALCVQPRPINQVFSDGGRTVTGTFSIDMNGSSGQLYAYFQNVGQDKKLVIIERMFCVKEQLADISIAATSEQVLQMYRLKNEIIVPGSGPGTSGRHRNGMMLWSDDALSAYTADAMPYAQFPFLVLKTRTTSDQFWSMDMIEDETFGTGPIILEKGWSLGLIGQFASPLGAGANASKVQITWTVSVVNEF